MEQIVILIFFILASAVSSYLQNKKKREQEMAGEEDPERRSGPPPASPGPLGRWPKSAADWQEQLRRMIEEHAPPVLRPPVEVPPVLPKSAPIPEIPKAIVIPKIEVKPTLRSRRSVPAAVAPIRVARWTRNRRAVREAFVASLIFSPPAAFAPPPDQREFAG